MTNKSLERLKKINTEITSLMDKGWKHISIINTVDKFFDDKGNVSTMVVTDVHGCQYTVDYKLLNDPNLKPGGGVLFNYERITPPPTTNRYGYLQLMPVIDETCKIISSLEVNKVFANDD